MTWFLEHDGVTLLTCVEDKTQPALPDPGSADLPVCMKRHPLRYPMKSHALKFKFLATSNVGAQLIAPAGRINATPTLASPQSIEPQGELSWHNNYFLGNDSTKWAPNCRNYTNIVYRDVWNGIDIEWYEENGKLEFDFVVQPGADPSQIRMSCEGLTGELSPTDNELKLPTSLGELRTALPQVYQISPGGSKSEVDAKFEIENKNEFGITLANGYQKEHTLRIDPLIYSTFLGGNDFDGGTAIANDGNDGVFITGYTQSTNFPVTPGVGQDFNDGSYDGFVTHLNATGTQLLYSTYLGGGSDDYAEGIIAADNGDVVVAGSTFSPGFPVTQNALQTTYGGERDGFVTRINASGSQLIFSTFLGGSSNDVVFGIISDESDGYYLTGATSSPEFPTTPAAFDTSYNDSSDCFVVHLNGSGSQLIYSTFLGGGHAEGARAITSDNHGGVIVTGSTKSPDFPVTHGCFDSTYNDTTTSSLRDDCFITRLDSTGSHLIYSTYLGGSYSEEPYGVAGDGNGGCYIIGQTSSSDFPVTPGAYDTTINVPNYLLSSFITHLDSSGASLDYSTFLGGSHGPQDYGTWGFGIMASEDGSVIVAGSTSCTDFPVTPDAFQPNNNGMDDVYLCRLNSTGSQLLYSTYLGGESGEVGFGLAKDLHGGIFVTGYTGYQSDANFPVTPGAYDTTWNGSTDCFVVHFSFDSTGIIQQREKIPTGFTLAQNYPNPFNSSTTISYSLPKPGIAKLELFDLLGRRISTLINTPQNAGVLHIRFDGKNLASGEYFYRLSAGDFQETRKLLLLK